jgi:hypothetical protein
VIAPRIVPLLRTPAFQALMIQCAAFMLVLALVVVMPRLTDLQLTVGIAALLQGTVAALISRWRRLAVWWLPIQFFFPGALMAMHALDWPPSLFLAAFIFLLALYWTTFRTQVPFFPSSTATWEAVAALVPQGRPIRFIDIGSGFGGLILSLAERRPDSEFVGIELAPLPWLASVMRAGIRRSGGRFIRGTYEDLDFAEYDIVFAYLSPAAMPALWEKAKGEMRIGTLLLSNEFPISGVKSHIIVMPVAGGPALFGWQM